MKRFFVLTAVVIAAGAIWFFWPPPADYWPPKVLQAATERSAAKEQRRAGRRGARDAEEAVPVVVARAETRDVPVVLEGVGSFQAPNTVTVRPQVDGTLVEVAFREGQDVKKGDVLARIDPLTFQAQYDQAVAQKAQTEAQLANARRDYERYSRLARNDYATQQQADTAKSTIDQLQAQVRYYAALIDQAKTTLDRAVVRAPISGRTGVRGVDQGNYVTAGETTGLVTITQLQPIAARFTLPQQNIAAITRALARGPVAVEALSGDGAEALDEGALDVVDNQVDQTTGTVKLKATFPNAQLSLWPGQFTTIRVAVDVLKGVTTVPGPAVQQGPDGPFVFLVKDKDGADIVEQRAVTVTRQDTALAVIASGVAVGDHVVVTGFTRLRDGAKVDVGPAGGAKEPEEDAPGVGAEARDKPQRRAQGGTP